MNDLTKAKVGEVYKVYLDDNFAIVHPKAVGLGMYGGYKTTWVATVIQVDDEEKSVMLGWRAEDGMCPTGSKDLTSWHKVAVHPKIKCLSNWTDYRMGQWVPMSLMVAGCIKQLGATEGHNCKECGDFCQYAVHDPADGPYVCGLCRGRTRILTGG